MTWPLHSPVLHEPLNAGANVETSGPWTLVMMGNNNTPEAWKTIAPRTPRRFDGLRLFIGEANSANAAGLLDIAIGPAGGEVIVAEHLAALQAVGDHVGDIDLPLVVPAGVRLSMRGRCPNTSGGRNHKIGLHGYAQAAFGRRGFQACESYGIDPSNSAGTAYDCGATENTRAGWVQMTARTRRVHRALLLIAGTAGNGALSNGSFWFDVGVGAAGGEAVLARDLHFRTQAGPDIMQPISYLVPADVPLGSRLAINGQSEITDASDRVLDFALYGLS